MADVPIRNKQSASPWQARWAEIRAHVRPLVIIAGIVILLIGVGGITREAIRAYRQQLTLTGLTADRSLVRLTIGDETLTIPANMLRFASARAGGLADHADLALLWPNLEGYSDDNAAAFMDGAISPNIIYATVSPRDSELDSTGRLDAIYSRLFVGKPVAGPAGLVGRTLGPDSGYDGEIVYFSPSDAQPFVARCPQATTPDIPATCIRDIHVGRALTLLYRFDKARLTDWRALDAATRNLADKFLAP